MPIATGLNKQVAYKAETTWGTLAGNTGGKLLRRVTANFNLEKESYESNELRTDLQTADMRHGVKSAVGTLSGEMSPGSYSEIYAAVLSRDFTSVTNLTGITYSIAVSGNYWSLTRSAGNFLTDGIKIGYVIRVTAAGGNTNNTGKNLLVLAVTALVLTVVPLNGSTLTAESGIASATVVIPGKVTYAPTSGHTDKSFTIEEWYSDIAQSEVYTGLKVNTVGISLPATGLATNDFSFMGKDLTQTGTTQYFTSPTAQSTTGTLAAVNGILMLNGAPVALLTGINLNINRNMQSATVVGSNSIAELFEGRILVDGDFSAYFQDASVRDMFKDETETSIVVALSASSDKASDFVSISLPRVKINSFTKDDGEQGVTAQCSFRALLNSVGGSGVATEKTTILIHDSQA